MRNCISRTIVECKCGTDRSTAVRRDLYKYSHYCKVLICMPANREIVHETFSRKGDLHDNACHTFHKFLKSLSGVLP